MNAAAVSKGRKQPCFWISIFFPLKERKESTEICEQARKIFLGFNAKFTKNWSCRGICKHS